MGGLGIRQHILHRYVLEAATGLPQAQAESKRMIRFGVGASLVFALTLPVLAKATGNSLDTAVRLGIGLTVAGLPFSIWGLNYALRVSLEKENLRLKRMMIGRRIYHMSSDRKLLLGEGGMPVDTDFYKDAGLFGTACSLAIDEPALLPTGGLGAWHYFRTFDEFPGSAVGFNSYGPGGRTYAFVYGPPKILLSKAADLWDLGYVRKLSETDIRLFRKTLSAWNRRPGTILAFAYAPLPAGSDPQTLTAEEIAGSLAFLGLADLDGTREYGRSFPIEPAASLLIGARAGLSSTMAVLFAGLVSYLGVILLSLPPYIGILQILILKLAVEIPPIVSLAWDNAGSASNARPKTDRFLNDGVWTGLLISGLALANYVFYFIRHNFEITSVEFSSNAHRGAMATVLLSIALCLLINIVLMRNKGRVLSRFQLYNPLFILGLSSAILALLIGTYATGPLTASDIWASLAAALTYVSIRKLQAYADTHHTREHILELLKTV